MQQIPIRWPEMSEQLPDEAQPATMLLSQSMISRPCYIKHAFGHSYGRVRGLAHRYAIPRSNVEGSKLKLMECHAMNSTKCIVVFWTGEVVCVRCDEVHLLPLN
jgi:hypothetical protein